MIRFNKARLVGVRLVVLSFVLAAFTGLSAQNDTTFVANENPIIKYKYVGDSAAMVHDGKVYIYDGHDECPPLNEHYLINEWCVFSSPDLKTWTEHPVPLKAKDFSWAKGEAWASQVIERDGKFYSEKICYAMNRSITGPWEYEDIDRLYYNEDGTMKRIQMTTEGVQ